MPPLKINTPQTGGISLLQWLNEPSNTTPIVEVSDNIIPVQEMSSFQGKWFYINASLAVPQNDFFSFLAIVPDDECWRIDRMVVFHIGAADLQFEISNLQANVGGIGGITVIHRDATPPNVVMTLYPSRKLKGDITSEERFEHIGQRLVALPQESILIRTGIIPDAGGNTINVTVRYEQIPPPIQIPRISAVVPDVEAL